MLTLVVSAVAVALAVLMAVVITRRRTAQLGGELAELARGHRGGRSAELMRREHVRPGDTGSVMASAAAMREQLAGRGLLGCVPRATASPPARRRLPPAMPT